MNKYLLIFLFLLGLEAKAQEYVTYFQEGQLCGIVFSSGEEKTGLTYRFIDDSRRTHYINDPLMLRFLEEEILPYHDTLQDSVRSILPDSCANDSSVRLDLYIDRDGICHDVVLHVNTPSPPDWLTEELVTKLYRFLTSLHFPRASDRYYHLFPPKWVMPFPTTIRKLMYGYRSNELE